MSTWKTAGQTEEVERGYGDPMQDPRYAELLKRLQTIHAELLKTELKVENPALIGDTLGELRLGANQLFAFLNYYIDALSDLELAYAKKRQALFTERLALPKSSPSGSEGYAREMTRVDEAEIKVVQNRINQIKNNYERFNGIAIYLQTRLKEFNTERMMS